MTKEKRIVDTKKASILFFIFCISFLFPTQKAFCEKKLKIAVIPFSNISGKTENDWIGAGFSETMVTALSNIKNVQITERFLMNQVLKEIAFQQSGFIEDKNLVKVGKLTGANIIISGSFQVINNEIVINSRFIDLENGTVENGSAFYLRGEMNKIFDLEEKLAQGFNQKFTLIPTEQEGTNIKTAIYSTNSVDANKLYITARNRYQNGGVTGKKEAMSLLKESIKLDPNYALALALLGEIEMEYYNLGTLSKSIFRIDKDYTPFYKDGLENIKKALKLAPDSYEVLRSMAKVSLLDKNETDAENFINKALTLKPDDVSSILIKSFLKKEKNLELINKAISIDPYNYESYLYLGRYYIYYNGEKPDLDKATKNLLKAVELNPYSWEANMQLVQAYVRAKDFKTAIAWSDRMILMEKNIVSYMVASSAYLGSGNFEKLKEFYTEVDKMVDSPFIKTILGGLYLKDKDYKTAYKIIRNGLDKHYDDPFLNQVMSEIYMEYFGNCKYALYHLDIFLKNISKLSLPQQEIEKLIETNQKKFNKIKDTCS